MVVQSIVALTATCLGKVHQAQRGIISWHGLEGNIRVPLGAVLLLGAELIRCLPFVQLAVLHRADSRDFLVVATKLSRVVEDRVDVKPRGLRTPCQLSEPQDKLLLEVVGESVLGTEKHHSTLGDYYLRVSDFEHAHGNLWPTSNR